MIDSSKQASETILGVERENLEILLTLVRDSYPIANKANLFLESHTKKVYIAGITNLRDVLSHVATFLDSSLPPSKRAEQIINAKEHIRRAIIEPYEVAFLARLNQFERLYEKYKSLLLPAIERFTSLHGAPDKSMIEARLKNVRDLSEQGRLAKGNNDWNESWERGVKAYTDAFDEICKLYSTIEDYWFRYEYLIEQEGQKQQQIQQHKHEMRYHLKGHLLHYGGYALVLLVLTFDHRRELWRFLKWLFS